MGTRSLTVFQDIEYPKPSTAVPLPAGIMREIVVMYRQYDGYPGGHGKELMEFLTPFKLTNGYSPTDNLHTTANGMGCLAAQVVAHFKKECGGFYLEPAGTRDCGEEYIYYVYPDKEGDICVQCENVHNEIVFKTKVKDADPDRWGK